MRQGDKDIHLQVGVVISRVAWNQGTGLEGVTELYLRAVRGEGTALYSRECPERWKRYRLARMPQ